MTVFIIVAFNIECRSKELKLVAVFVLQSKQSFGKIWSFVGKYRVCKQKNIFRPQSIQDSQLFYRFLHVHVNFVPRESRIFLHLRVEENKIIVQDTLVCTNYFTLNQFVAWTCLYRIHPDT